MAKTRKGKNQKLQERIALLEEHIRNASPVWWMQCERIQDAYDWEKKSKELIPEKEES